jgi:alpha-amylase
MMFRSGRLLLATCLLMGLAAACAGDETSTLLTTQVGDWRDEVIYQIVVDRFDNGDPQNDAFDGVGTVSTDLKRFQGGDWRGIQNRLPYLKRLGVTAIWISPIVSNVERTDYQDGYHGYWASDFTTVNRRFGSLADLQSLVRESHRQGIKVIIDVVTNHAGRVFFYDFDKDGVADPGEQEPAFSKTGPHQVPIVWQSSPPKVFSYADGVDGLRRGEPELLVLQPEHFHRRGQTLNFFNDTQKWHGDFPTGLRDLDTEHEKVVKTMIDTYLRWVELTDVDGFRLDAVPHVPHRFWARFCRELRRELAARGKERFMFLGEVFDRDPKVLAAYTRDGALDTVFDFPLKWQVIDGFILDGYSADSVTAPLERHRGEFPGLGHSQGIELSPWQARVAMADNHDVPRVLGELNDPFAVELAMAIVFTVDAIPSIYYGTEQGLRGGWGDSSRTVLWRKGFDERARLFKFIQRLATIRKQSVALRRGALSVRYASKISAREAKPGDGRLGAGLMAYERSYEDDRVLVVLNSHPIESSQATIPTGFAPGTKLHDALYRKTSVTVDQNGNVTVELPPRRALILK